MRNQVLQVGNTSVNPFLFSVVTVVIVYLFFLTFFAGLPSKSDGTGNKAFSVETPDQRDSGRDSSLDYKPKKGLIFEICSDDGFQIRCESIEGKRDLDNIVHLFQTLVLLPPTPKFLFVSEAWKSLTDKVQEARTNARLKALSFDGKCILECIFVLYICVHLFCIVFFF